DKPASLDDALELLGAHGIGIELDLKTTGIEDGIAQAVRRHALVTRVFVASTWAASLRRLAEIAPEVQRAISYPHDRHGVSGFAWPHVVTAGSGAAPRL